jgi:oligopeptidase B
MTKKSSQVTSIFLVLLVSITILTQIKATEIKESIIVPKAKKERYEQSVHGDVIVDYYHWLKDKDWPKVNSAEIVNHLKEENQYTENYFSPYKVQEEKLIKEIKSRIIEEDETYPKKFDNYFYYRKFIKGGNHFIICRKKNSLRAKEEIILDVNKLSEGRIGYGIGVIVPSPDHANIAYSADIKGREKYSISIKNLETGEVDSDVVNDMWGNIIWHGSNKGFFYTKKDNELRSTEVYYHELGKKQLEDALIYKEYEDGFLIDIGRTSDKKYLIINSSNNTENKISIIDIEMKVILNPKLLLSKKQEQLYYIDHGNNTFYLKINDKGKNFRLVKLKNNDFNNKKKWTEVIPHSDIKFLSDFSLSNKYLTINVGVNGANKILVFDRYGKYKEVKFDEDAYSAYAYFTTYESDLLRIEYSSFTTPPSVLEYDCKKEKIYNRKTKVVSGGYDKEKYQSEKIYITSDDGVQIPISLFYRKDKFKKDGTNPLLLYGYGAYGISSFANFDTNIFSLIDRGFVYAIAHIRGGSELGYKWYEDAKHLTKKRTFLDYINCAEGLIKMNYASPKKIIGYGISAGGMLIGYVINERPDLLKIAVAEVPSVDTLNKMLDDTLMGTPFHFKELGNPQIKREYDYIKSYSPYNNIKKQNYPAVYATAGLYDSRVTYWQPAKWIAKLREYNKSKEPILLYIDMESGHFGKSGRYSNVKQKAMMFNFILLNLDI